VRSKTKFIFHFTNLNSNYQFQQNVKHIEEIIFQF